MNGFLNDTAESKQCPIIKGKCNKCNWNEKFRLIDSDLLEAYLSAITHIEKSRQLFTIDLYREYDSIKRQLHDEIFKKIEGNRECQRLNILFEAFICGCQKR